MSKENDDFLFDEGTELSSEGGHPQPADPVETLSWALLDEQITEDEIGLLDTLLLSDASARVAYLGCVQLHTDLPVVFTVASQASTTSLNSPAPTAANSATP